MTDDMVQGADQAPDEDEVVPGGTPVGEDAPWDAWSPREAAARLAGVDVPWAVAGGWALDLFRGEVTREHSDLEIAVPAARSPRSRRRPWLASRS
jgi:hypothetical protein